MIIYDECQATAIKPPTNKTNKFKYHDNYSLHPHTLKTMRIMQLGVNRQIQHTQHKIIFRYILFYKVSTLTHNIKIILKSMKKSHIHAYILHGLQKHRKSFDHHHYKNTYKINVRTQYFTEIIFAKYIKIYFFFCIFLSLDQNISHLIDVLRCFHTFQINTIKTSSKQQMLCLKTQVQKQLKRKTKLKK
eukprot:TRINITY_DN8744_c0_g1_i4.p1 TRINITY_DN8744_c0_g1~~TRINITY_DN8744_c0_g1_i4.p1  ORF type:complete len:189 (+),score=-20.78 TRINITY_DN8744_c0_g1_i4:167-733(+)